MNIFVINPGSTSTKVALFQDDKCVHDTTIRHNPEEIAAFSSIADQFEYRFNAIKTILEENCKGFGPVDVFVGRGGFLKPLESGTYKVNQDMLDDLSSAKYGSHASNLGGIIADKLAKEYGKEAYIVNPVVVDELMDIARFTGLPQIRRQSVFHALNQKAVAMAAAADAGIEYTKCNLIVAHLGGGVSVGAHQNGKVVDVNNGVEEGPFSPERAGKLPVLKLTEMCFSGQYTKDEIKKMLVGKGGLYAYAGTSDARVVEQKAKTDKEIKLALDAMIYQVAREICASAAPLYGKIDRIVITGGLAYSKYITEEIKKYVSFLAPVVIVPGEDELAALAEGAIRVYQGKEKAGIYVK